MFFGFQLVLRYAISGIPGIVAEGSVIYLNCRGVKIARIGWMNADTFIVNISMKNVSRTLRFPVLVMLLIWKMGGIWKLIGGVIDVSRIQAIERS